MIIVMQPHASSSSIDTVVGYLRQAGLQEHVSIGAERVIIGAVGDERILDVRVLEQMPQVERAVRIVHDWRIISREAQPQNSVYVCLGLALGQEVVMVTDDVQSDLVYVDAFYRPHNPYHTLRQDNEAHIERQMAAQVSVLHQQGKPVMARVRDLRQLDPILSSQVDVIYVGGEWLESRSMQSELGQLNIPVVVCKDKHHTFEQWLVCAERVAMHGNHHIILGEAGTLNIHASQVYRLDVEAIAQAVKHTHLPVLANVTRLGHGVLSQQQLTQLAVIAGAKLVLQAA